MCAMTVHILMTFVRMKQQAKISWVKCQLVGPGPTLSFKCEEIHPHLQKGYFLRYLYNGFVSLFTFLFCRLNTANHLNLSSWDLVSRALIVISLL